MRRPEPHQWLLVAAVAGAAAVAVALRAGVDEPAYELAGTRACLEREGVPVDAPPGRDPPQLVVGALTLVFARDAGQARALAGRSGEPGGVEGNVVYEGGDLGDRVRACLAPAGLDD